MKIIKAKIKVTHDNGGTQYVYPQLWLDNKERIPMISYQSDRTDEITTGQNTYQTCYPLVPDDLYAQMLAQHPEIFSVTNQVEFEAHSAKHNPTKQTITDKDALLTFLTKVALGETLTKEEKDKLDPKKEGAFITETPKEIDVAITKYGATF